MPISLTAGMRNALNSLTDLQSNIQNTNNRLATGKKVNTPLDNALSFFQADSLSSRARGISSIQDNIGLGIQVIKQTDKALNSMKASLEQAEGALRGALNSTGTNAKAVSTFAFRNSTTGVADATALLTEAAAGTSINRLQAGDTITVNLVRVNGSGVATAIGTGTTLTTAATTTVQNLLDNINNNTSLNVAGQSGRVSAYLNDSGNIVVENRVNGRDAATGETFALQFVVNTAGGGTQTQNNTTDVFAFSGAVGSLPTSTGSGTQTVTMLGGSTEQTTRAAAATSFRELLTQVRNTALDAGYNGTNLLQGDFLRTGFNETGSTSVTTQGRRIDATSLGFALDNPTAQSGDAARNFQSDREITAALTKITAAKETVNAVSATFSNNATILQNRQNFNNETIKTLNEGADLLTLADINEEGAALTSLQTRQQLSITALSLANQSDQAILRLF
ncbi:MAG: flagellin [Bosea sp. (in: a-proteobacteria)]